MYRVTAFFIEDVRVLMPDITIGYDINSVDEAMSKSLWYGDRLIAVGGIIQLWNGVGMAWAIVDKNIPSECVKKTAILFKKWFHKMAEHYGFHRIQADVKSDNFEKGHKFVKFLGFKHEGKMTAYGSDKEDHDRYALVR